MSPTAGKPEIDARPPRASFPRRLGLALLRVPRHLPRVVWRLLVGLFFFLAILFLLIRHVLMPQVAHYRPDIEAALSRGAGLPVKIARLDADWNGLRPALNLRGVQFIDSAGGTALELPEIGLEVAWSSLWHWDLRLHRLEIVRPELDIRREHDGRIFVAGLPVSGGTAGRSPFQDFVLQQDRILIRDGRVVWTDLQRAAPPLALDHVQFRIDNFLNSHRFALRADPPAASSTSLDLRGDLRGASFSDLENWRGKLYLSLDNADLAVWQKWTDYPLHLPRGRGGLRAWLDFNGRDVTGMTADVALADLSLRMGEGVPQLDLASMKGRMKFSLNQGVMAVTAERLTLAAQNGLHIGPTSLKLRYAPARGKQGARGEFSTEQQDVQVLARLAAFLPLPEEARRHLVTADPAGRVERIDFKWEGSAPGVTPAQPLAHFSIAARASALTLHPVGGMPGFTGLGIEVQGSERAGSFTTTVNAGGLFLPTIMHEPWLPLSEARLAGAWSHEQPAGEKHERLTLKVEQGQIANEHLSASVSGFWQARENGPGYLDLKARAPLAPLGEVWRYIPHAAPADVVVWLHKSLNGGQGENLRFQLTGDLANFPFNRHPGVFKLETRIRDGVISEFSHGWPGMQALQGSFVLDRQRMTILAESGRYGNAVARGVKVEIPDLMNEGKQVLTVEGKASGPNTDFLNYVNASHLREISGGFTADIRAQGSGELDLRLDIPLHEAVQTRVNGSYDFQAASLRLTPVLPDFSAVKARLGFTEHGLSLPSARAQFLGRPVSATGRTEDDGSMRFDAQGNLTVAGLKELARFNGWEYLSGESPVSVVVRVRSGVLEVGADSTLAGISSSLPAPYAKTALERWPLRFLLRQEHHANASSTQTWRVTVPARLDLLWLETCGDHCSMSAGALGLADTAVLPAQGWQINASLPEVDADLWRPVLQRIFPSGDGASASAGSGSGSGGEESTEIAGNVRVGRLLASGYAFREVVGRISKRGPTWRALLDGPDLAGEVSWRDQGNGVVQARMKRLVLASAEPAAAAAAARMTPEALEKLPSLDVVAEAFEFRKFKLGRLNLVARNEGGVWKLDQIGLKTPDMELSGAGEWQPAGLTPGTSLDFKLHTTDAGTMLGRIGYPDMLRGGVADFSGKASWRASPVSLDFGSLNGRVRLDASSGQFREMEPGAGRLLGILSLQSLPRRITLDFNDVFSAGFAFDRIAGGMDIVDGVLHANDLEVRGPAARVFIGGSTDLGRETHNLHIKIQPTLSETVAVGVIVGQAAVGVLNPAVGAAAYLAQKLLRDPVEKIFSYEYSMTGSWADPKVEKIGGLLVMPQNPGAAGVSNLPERSPDTNWNRDRNDNKTRPVEGP
ncbi:YhdP family protein [Uliginosibacterium paludis]|uniref:YhdP family protein n=1 Tax=Uliginosibacterium paludis TaxID=1615952 RepID=A0ABV2CRG2_9RHOO